MSQSMVLDPHRKSDDFTGFQNSLYKLLINQSGAVTAISEAYMNFAYGFNEPNAPVASMLFLGGTGVGKTRAIAATAQVLYNNPGAFTRIDCGEFQNHHDVAKLTGAPPGYLGHKDPPLLTRPIITKHFTDKTKIALILFDEIEKADPALFDVLLSIMDRGELTLGDGSVVSMRDCIIFFTSNLGSREIAELTHGKSIGFGVNTQDPQDLVKDIATVGIEAVRRYFRPEFFNRLNHMVVFNPLDKASVRRIVDLELKCLQDRLDAHRHGKFTLSCSDEAKDVLAELGYDIRYGARELKRVIKAKLIIPINHMVASRQIIPGDVVTVTVNSDNNEFVYTKTVVETRMLVST